MTTMIFNANAEPRPDAMVIPVPAEQEAVIKNTFFGRMWIPELCAN